MGVVGFCVLGVEFVCREACCCHACTTQHMSPNSIKHTPTHPRRHTARRGAAPLRLLCYRGRLECSCLPRASGRVWCGTGGRADTGMMWVSRGLGAGGKSVHVCIWFGVCLTPCAKVGGEGLLPHATVLRSVSCILLFTVLCTHTGWRCRRRLQPSRLCLGHTGFLLSAAAYSYY